LIFVLICANLRLLRIGFLALDSGIKRIEMDEFEIRDAEYIELASLLKATGLCSSGGAAKMAIAEGQVRVDGGVERRKRCKIRPGQVVEFEGQVIAVR
jgi:ribosome-associated protein